MAILLLSGCDDRSRIDAAESELLEFMPIGTGNRGTLTDSTEITIRDPAVWAAYRDSLSPTEPFREVDFDQSFVILVALPQETSGYAVDFVSIERTDTAAVATYVVNVPGYDCLTASALTVPFSAVMVRSGEEAVRFHRVFEEYQCTGRRRR
jgi:hypothetical protein